jgi:hypothetical protein
MSSGIASELAEEAKAVEALTVRLRRQLIDDSSTAMRIYRDDDVDVRNRSEPPAKESHRKLVPNIDGQVEFSSKESGASSHFEFEESEPKSFWARCCSCCSF